MRGFATYLEHISTNDDNISHCWFPDRTTNQAFSFPRVPGYFIRFIQTRPVLGEETSPDFLVQFFSHFPSSGGSVNDYLSLSSWMGTSQIWLNTGFLPCGHLYCVTKLLLWLSSLPLRSLCRDFPPKGG